MKNFLPFLFLLILVPNTTSFAQQEPEKAFADFLDSQKEQPDSVRFTKLYDHTFDLSDHLKYVEAGMAVNKLLDMAGQANNARWEGRAYMAKAYKEKSENNPTLAISSYQKAQIAFHSIGDFQKEIRVFQRIGGVYIRLNDLKLAEYYLQRAMKLAAGHQIENEIAYLYTDFATLADIRKDFASALTYNKKSIDILKKIGDDFSATLFNRGIILKNAGRYAESVAIYMKVLEDARKNGDKELEEAVYINLPNTLVLLNRLDEAEDYAKKALEISGVSPQRVSNFTYIYESLTSIYQKMGSYQKAFESQKQWMAYRDSTFDAEKSRQLIETETRFQTREKQQQIQRLDEDNLNKKQQLWWLYGGVSLLALLLVIALWQYRVIRIVNDQLGKTNMTLSDANRQINLQSNQLKELMQELHHRVKNNLAIVSSLLSLQADRLHDEKAVQAVMEGQQRVEAMSLIHNQLYQTENVTRVSMQEYIGDLARGLMQSFSYKENFGLKLDIEPIELDVEVAVPLGLIMNELVTNAFKHAYKGVAEPELSIRLWQEGKIHLEIKDNGPGIDMEKWQKGGTSFGKRLIKSLTKQVKGKLEIASGEGSCFLLVFPAAQIARPAELEHA